MNILSRYNINAMITSLLILLLVVTLPTIVHISRIITRMPRRARRMKRITSSYKSRVLSYGRACFYKFCINCLIFTLRQISRLSFLATRVLSFHRRIYDWIRNVLGLLEPVIHVNSVYNLVALSMHDYNNSVSIQEQAYTYVMIAVCSQTLTLMLPPWKYLVFLPRNL